MNPTTNYTSMNRSLYYGACCLLAITGLINLTGCSNNKNNSNKSDTLYKAKLTLPPGFSATIIADSLGALRHLAVTNQGDIYVKLNSLKDGKGIYFLSDTNHDGRIDQKTGFGNYPGTGIIIKDNDLYASSNSGVFKYKLNDKGAIIDNCKPETIVQGMVDRKRDNSKSIAIDNQDNL